MNYYKRHLGDLAKSCGHLSQAAFGAYSLLMDWCYSNERELPKLREELYEIGRARDKAGRDNVDRVIATLFDETETGYTQKRVVEEIAAFKARQVTNRRVGKLGGRPKVPRGTTETETETVSESDSEQKPRNNPSHKPVIHKQVDTPKHAERTLSAPTDAGRACRLMREVGCAWVNPSHVDLLAALAEGVTPEVLRDTAVEAVEAGKTKPFTWAIATARGRRKQGANPIPAGAQNHAAPQPRESLADRSARRAAAYLNAGEADGGA